VYVRKPNKIPEVKLFSTEESNKLIFRADQRLHQVSVSEKYGITRYRQQRFRYFLSKQMIKYGFFYIIYYAELSLFSGVAAFGYIHAKVEKRK